MKTRDEYRKEREQLSDSFQDMLQRKIAAMHSRLYTALSPFFDAFDTNDGNVQYNIRNITKTGQAQRIILDFTREEKPGLIGWILNKADQLFRVNRLYFQQVPGVEYEPKTVDARVRQKIFLNLGYDVNSNQLIPGGWIDSLTNADEVALRVAQDMQNAVTRKMPLQEFKKTFRAAFINPKGLGYLERHYNTFAFDLYQSVDRQTQQQYSEQLGLNYALYSGGLIKTSRDFCEARSMMYYSKDEIRKWKSEEFQGKLKNGYDPFIHCGGYNCRHHLSFVSEEFMVRTGKIKSVDTYK